MKSIEQLIPYGQIALHNNQVQKYTDFAQLNKLENNIKIRQSREKPTRETKMVVKQKQNLDIIKVSF